MKTTSDIPTGAQESLSVTLLAPPHNVGKDEYPVRFPYTSDRLEDMPGWGEDVRAFQV